MRTRFAICCKSPIALRPHRNPGAIVDFPSSRSLISAAHRPAFTARQPQGGKLMNWKIIFLLSLFGLAMGIATVFVIPSNIEPLFWLVIFVISAFVIARAPASRHFLHGLLVGIVNSVWITGAHILFVNQYLANHAKEAAMMQNMPRPDS